MYTGMSANWCGLLFHRRWSTLSSVYYPMKWRKYELDEFAYLKHSGKWWIWGINEMSQWVRVPESNPQHSCKDQLGEWVPETPELWIETRKILRPSRSVSLTQMVSFQYSESPCLKAIRQKAIDEYTCPTLAAIRMYTGNAYLHTYIHELEIYTTNTHKHIQVHIHAHTHIYMSHVWAHTCTQTYNVLRMAVKGIVLETFRILLEYN